MPHRVAIRGYDMAIALHRIAAQRGKSWGCVAPVPRFIVSHFSFTMPHRVAIRGYYTAIALRCIAAQRGKSWGALLLFQRSNVPTLLIAHRLGGWDAGGLEGGPEGGDHADGNAEQQARWQNPE